jgi:probable HAF family extracellular repeat protein
MRLSPFLLSMSVSTLLITSMSAKASSINNVDLPGGIVSGEGYAISSDGSTFVGSAESGLSYSEAFKWTSASGVSALGFLDNSNRYSEAFAVNADGSVIVGVSRGTSGVEAFMWTAGGGMVGLGDLAGGFYNSQANGISGDGTIIVGFSEAGSGYEAFRWTAGTGMVGLGDLAGGIFNSGARAISADGTVIVGGSESTNGTEAFRWTSGGGMVGLGDLGGSSFGSDAFAVNSDGSVIVGYANSTNGAEAFRWTSGGGMVGLGDLAGGTFESRARAVNADGSVVVGYSDGASGSEAFRWTQATGMQSITTLLLSDGVDLTGYVLTSAKGVDASGNIIVGDATLSGDSVAFIANLSTGGITTPQNLSAGLESGIIPVQQVQSAASNNLGQSLFAATQSSALFSSKTFSAFDTSNFDANLSPSAISPAAGGDEDAMSWNQGLERRWAAYMVGSFGLGQNNDTDNTSLNGTTGLMVRVTNQWIVGLGIIGSHNTSDMALGGESKLNAMGGSIVTSYEGEGGFRFYGSAFAAHLDIDTERNYLNGAAIDVSHGSTSGMGYGGAVRAGWEFPVSNVRIMPYGEVQVSTTQTDSYTETDGSFPATFGSTNAHQTTTRLGTQVSYDVTSAITVSSRLAWAHRLNEATDGISASSTGFTGTVGLPSGDRNWGELSLEGGWQITPDTHVSAELTGRSGRTQDPVAALTIGLSTRF